MRNLLMRNSCVAAGILLLLAALVIPARAQITVGGNGANTSDSTSYSGSQSLTKIGSNTVTLSGNNTYTGGTLINAGTMVLGGGSSTGGNFTIGNGAELRVTARDYWFNGTPAFNFMTNGGGTINTWGGVNFIMGGNAIYTSAGGARNRIIGGSGINLNNNTSTFNVARGNDVTTDLEMEATLWNSGNIVKTGNGIMTLTGANSYSGTTDIQAGTLVAANNSALGAGGHSSSTMTYIRDGATLALQGGVSLSEHFHVWGAGVGGLGAIRNLSGNNALNNSPSGGPGYALRSDSTVGVDAGSLSISGFYESGGSFGLTKIGAGTLTLTTTNTYTGKTKVNAGTLVLGAGSSDIRTWNSSIDINNGSTVSVAGARFDLSQSGAARTVTFGATGGNTFDSGTGVNLVDWAGNTFRTTGGARNFITGSSGLNINSGFTATLDVARGTDATSDLTVSSFFWNGGGIAKTGNGIVTLTGTNTYSGTTTISAGTLQVGNGGTSGTLGSGNVVNNATLALNRSDSHTVSNVISGTGSLIKIGTGTTTLTGDNTYSGGTFVNAGTLNLGAGSTNAGASTAVGPYTIGNGATLQVTAAQFWFHGNPSFNFTTNGGGTIDTYSGVNFVMGGNGTFTSAGGSQNLIKGSSGINLNYNTTTFDVARGTDPNSDLLVAARIWNNGNIVKTGNGIMTLTGDNTYSGGTFVNAGTLNLGGGSTNAGASTAVGPYTIGNGATLQVTAAQFWFHGNPSFNFTTNGGGTIDTYSGVNFIMGGNGTFTSAGGSQNLIKGSSGINLNFNTTTFNVVRGSDPNADLLVSARVWNGGNIVKTGNGIMSLTGTNDYSGTTTISAGTLQVGNGGTSGTLGSGNVINNAALAFNRSDSHTVSNTISGTGSLEKQGAGTATLTGNNSYSGTTTVSAGTLQVGNGGTSGTLGSGNVINNAALAFNRSDSHTVSNAISGTGSLEKQGVGTSTLAGNNSYSGTTTISAGTLQVGNGGTSGTLGSGNIVNNAALAFNRSDSHTVSNTISGTGSLEKQGVGTSTLAGNNSYSGTTTISAGTLQVGNGGTNGTLGSGAVVNNAALVLNRSDSIAVSNQISGTGSVAQNGGGTTILSAANTYTGGTVINNGTLVTAGNERLADTGAVTVNSGATFRLGGNETIASLNGSGTADLGNKNLTLSSGSFAGALAGSGDLYKTGAGAFTLSGTSSGFLGDLYLQGGSVVANSSTALNANNFVLLSAGSTFTANQNLVLGGIDQNGGTIDGSGVITSVSTITRSGSINTALADAAGYNSGLFKIGSGTTTLGAANTYTGTTKVSEGTLALGAGGSLSAGSSAQVASGATLDLAERNQSLKDVKANGTIAGSGTMTVTGTLSGSGTVQADTVVTGIHSPGNSPGIQNFGGNLDYQPGSTMLWQLADNTTANSPLAYDQVMVGGNLAFNGGTSLVLSFNDVGSVVNWTDSLWASDQSWTIYQVAGLTSGLENLSLADYTALLDAYGNDFGTTRAGSTFSISQNGQDVTLTYTVPEPSTYALIGLGGLALVVAYRRKRG